MRPVPTKTCESPSRLRYVLWGISLALGFVHCWLGRTALHGMDGLSYLDMGDAYLRHDWKTAVNGLWSPLYAVLVSGVLKASQPSMRWEVPLVHIVGFGIYIGALFCFHFLWIQLGAVVRERSTSQTQTWATFSERDWLLLGYCIFLWVSLQLIGVVEEGPDMLVAALVYIASALLLRIGRDQASMGTFIALGMTLGLGYLGKTVLFPLSFVFLGVAAVVTYKKKQSLAQPVAALLVFLLVASPLLLALSRAKGRCTFGDAGRINYLWHVDGVPRMYWQGNYAGSGAPVHPPRLILSKPVVYEFAAPFEATFPPWYDPSYWYEGMNSHFDLGKQIRAVIEAAGIYHGLFFKPVGALIATSLTLLMLGTSVRDLGGRLDVLLPAIAAFGLYALVHVEPRYLGSFLLVFWGGVLCQLRLPNTDLARRLLRFSTLTIVIIYSIELCVGAFGRAAEEKDLAARMQEALLAAKGMRQLGLNPGDHIATVDGISGMIPARLAKLRIIGDIPDDSDFWLQGSDTQSRALDALAKSGAKAVLAQAVPHTNSAAGWTRIGQTDYYLYSFLR